MTNAMNLTELTYFTVSNIIASKITGAISGHFLWLGIAAWLAVYFYRFMGEYIMFQQFAISKVELDSDISQNVDVGIEKLSATAVYKNRLIRANFQTIMGTGWFYDPPTRCWGYVTHDRNTFYKGSCKSNVVIYGKKKTIAQIFSAPSEKADGDNSSIGGTRNGARGFFANRRYYAISCYILPAKDFTRIRYNVMETYSCPIPTTHQEKIIDDIIRIYSRPRITRHATALISGVPGCGKTSIGGFVAAKMTHGYCFGSFDPSQPGSTLSEIVDEFKYIRDNHEETANDTKESRVIKKRPLVLVINEWDQVLDRVMNVVSSGNSTFLSQSGIPQIYDVRTINDFMDKINTTCDMITIFTTNKTLTDFEDKYGMFIRDGRIDYKTTLGKLSNDDMTDHITKIVEFYGMRQDIGDSRIADFIARVKEQTIARLAAAFELHSPDIDMIERHLS